ncbi:ABC-type Co2+ transport system, permease component [metagenome]|uniref:ABC-type Co2+ transport system, permease component n=1 Tax=metagenome TaxID=256318 RepID=A0A2P2CI93_9ZZZZ
MRTRTFVVTGLLIAFLIAGVASFYASSHPDGLNYVAEKTGFIDQEKDSATADGPFAGYSTKGLDNPRLSGGIAGVAGCLLVLGLAGGLTWAVRRRTPDAAGPDDQADEAGDRRQHESA